MKPAFPLLLFLSFFSIASHAQLCRGSLGDPIVNVTFGTGQEPIPFTKTGFEYKRGCPSRGQYTLANLIFGCGEDRSWLMLAGDHTGNEKGNYMFVNAESGDGVTKTAVVYTDTATGLCSNVNYIYSAWITNALRPISCGGSAIPASLSFSVTTLAGSVLGTYNTGNLPIEDEKRWKQYGLSFQVPPGENAVVLTVSTERKGGCGQGFAIDDITLRPCGPDIAATLNGSKDPVEVCANYGQPFVLKGSYAAGFLNPSVQWQRSLDTGKTWLDLPSATAVDHLVAPQSTGVVLFRMAVGEGPNVSSSKCRFLSNVIYTNVHPLPPHLAPQNLPGCLGKDLQLPEKDPFALQVLWTGPNGYSSVQEKSTLRNLSYADTGLYRMIQDFGYGCYNIDSFYVNAYPATTVSVPAVYSICEGQKVTLEASGDGRFSWQPSTGLSNAGVANPVASPRDTTQYKVVLTNASGCKDSALVMVHVFRNPVVSAGPEKTVLKGDTVRLNGSVSGTAVQWIWSPNFFMDDVTSLSPKVFPPADTRYTLTAVSTVGCGKAEAVVNVKVFSAVYLPSAFSPNNDGKNDYFRVMAAGSYQLLKFQVFNRWGEIIFRATDFSKGWDGKWKGVPQPQDTYAYFLQFKTDKGEVITRRGTITLIR